MADGSGPSGSGKSNETQLVAQYKDGKLQIVEVTPFDKNVKTNDGSENYILPDIMEGNQSDKGLLQLDLLNLTLVRCGDDSESYRLVANTESGSQDLSDDNTVACVLQSSDGEDTDGQESLVMVEGDQGPLVFLQPATVQIKGQQPIVQTEGKQIRQLTEVKSPVPTEILEKAKQIEQAKARALLAAQPAARSGRGRKRGGGGGLPPPHELLASPNFKLFVYGCKMCSYRCNAYKELTKHKAECHTSGRTNSRGSRGVITLQCARCPYRAPDRDYLTKHVNEKHLNEEETTSQSLYYSDKISFDSEEVAAADVLVCGACGFESASRDVFRKHIETKHGATTI